MFALLGACPRSVLIGVHPWSVRLGVCLMFVLPRSTQAQKSRSHKKHSSTEITLAHEAHEHRNHARTGSTRAQKARLHRKRSSTEITPAQEALSESSRCIFVAFHVDCVSSKHVMIFARVACASFVLTIAKCMLVTRLLSEPPADSTLAQQPLHIFLMYSNVLQILHWIPRSFIFFCKCRLSPKSGSS